MKKILITSLCAAGLFYGEAQAFDFASIVTNVVKDAVTEVATDVAKDTAKTTAKSVAKSQGIEGADQLIDTAVDNSDNIQNGVANASASAGALKGMAGSSPMGAASAVLSGVGLARGAAKMGGTNTPGNQFRQEYMVISTKLGNCKTNSCIQKYQGELLALQKRGNAYQANTGDANFDGKVNGNDARQARINAAMAKINSCAAADQACKAQGYEQLRAVDNLVPAQNGAPTSAHPVAAVATEAAGKLLGAFGFGK